MDLVARKTASEAKALVAGATSESRFYATLAAAKADSTLAVGQTFVSTDDGAEGPHTGIKWIYLKASSPSGWSAVRAWATGEDFGYPDDPEDLPVGLAAQEELNKRMETYVSDSEPTTGNAALWFKTTPGSTVATLWVQEA